MSYLDTRRAKKNGEEFSENKISRKILHEIYLELKFYYLAENKFCECGCGRRATEIHHKKGRIGFLLIDLRYFMAVAEPCHKKIERSPAWAKEKRFSVSRLKKTTT